MSRIATFQDNKISGIKQITVSQCTIPKESSHQRSIQASTSISNLINLLAELQVLVLVMCTLLCKFIAINLLCAFQDEMQTTVLLFPYMVTCIIFHHAKLGPLLLILCSLRNRVWNDRFKKNHACVISYPSLLVMTLTFGSMQ